ncbi:MAG: response regulator [Chitinophagaceae bacterium]|nr:response regulator [Chitinophagaceae bacterium]
MKHILIVDSDPLFTQAVSSVLAQEDFNVTTALNGKDAANKLRLSRYDLLITDVLMSYNTGLELLSEVRRKDRHRHTPVLVVTGISHEHKIADWFKAGADAYLKKPLDMPTLLLSVKQLVADEKYVAA